MNTVDIIRSKRDGQALSTEQISWLIKGVMDASVADYQLSAWLMAVALKGMTDRETADLTMALIASGKRLDMSSLGAFVGDKHSTGGVGDKTTLVVAPLVAARLLPPEWPRRVARAGDPGPDRPDDWPASKTREPSHVVPQ